jgi:O-acetyl-ADP-ribose deacetylase (regulator of RNase III)
MPLFECPRCRKRELVPLAFCESFLEGTRFIQSEDGTEVVYVLRCPECKDDHITVVEGDLLEQPVDVIVNAWNRNVVPWWLLLPRGVSGSIKRRGGTGPFKELSRHGPIPLGAAVLTSAGRLPFKGIIHVAGINLLWRASERSIRDSVRNALKIADEQGFKSIAFPLIGAGSRGFDPGRSKTIMLDELDGLECGLEVRVVVFRK